MFIGIITGDLYKSSTNYSKGVSYLKVMESMLNQIMKNDSLKISSVDSFRGDSFQITSHNPINLLRTAVFIRSYLRSYSDNFDDENMYDARVAISIDSINKYKIDKSSIFESAQIKSGRGLDLMSDKEMMIFDSSIEQFNMLYTPSIILLDALISMMSKPQSEILRELSYNIDDNIPLISEKLGKVKQVVYKTMKRGGVDKVMEFLEYNKRYTSSMLY